MNAKDAVKDLEEQAMLCYQRELKQEPSWLRAFMESLIPATSPSHGMGRNAAAARRNGPIRPNVTKEQEEALAVLLAHELAHLVLSHTIESYASTNLLWPQLEKLGWDSKSCKSPVYTSNS
jgi:HEXXH motif-containing protein